MVTDGTLDAYRAMAVRHAGEAREMLDAHLAGVDGMRMFSRTCLERQLGVASQPLCTLVVVAMDPADFLALAAPIHRLSDLPEGSQASVVDDDRMASIAAGVASDGLSNLPYLSLVPEGPDARVVQHEGRHRALTALGLGIERIPVQLMMPADGGHAATGIWHLMAKPPAHLLGEPGCAGIPGNDMTRIPTPEVPLSRHLSAIENGEAEAILRVLRTANRVVCGFEPDDGECPGTREWAEDCGQYTLRWMEPAERLEAVLEHLAGPSASPSP